MAARDPAMVIASLVWTTVFWVMVNSGSELVSALLGRAKSQK